MKLLSWAVLFLSPLAVVALAGAEEAADDGFVSLFNGKDLDGWVNINCAPGTFFVRDGEIITTGKPTGFLRTRKQYENFIAEFEWMHVNKKDVGNSGFFVWADPLPAVGTPYTRGIEVQVLVNLEKEGSYTSHGDLFSIHGATCKPDRPHPQGWARCLPSEKRCKGGGEWNHYRIIARDGVLKLHVNGKEVSGVSECRPRKGYLALESEGAECHFRNLKIKEFPSTQPAAAETAAVATGFRNLFTGLDLSGWKADEAARRHWQRRDWMLHYDGKAEATGAELRTTEAFGPGEFILDFRFPPKKGDTPAECTFVLREGEDEARTVKLSLRADGKCFWGVGSARAGGECKQLKGGGQWNRLHTTRKEKEWIATLNGERLIGLKEVPAAGKGPLVLRPSGAMDFGNLFVRELEK